MKTQAVYQATAPPPERQVHNIFRERTLLAHFRGAGARGNACSRQRKKDYRYRHKCSSRRGMALHKIAKVWAVPAWVPRRQPQNISAGFQLK